MFGALTPRKGKAAVDASPPSSRPNAQPVSLETSTAEERPIMKYLCLIRHGQGEHNPRKNPLALQYIAHVFKRDARLTGKGRQQAGALNSPMHCYRS